MRPGNRYARNAPFNATLSDLFARNIALVAVCRRCKHQKLLLPSALGSVHGPDLRVEEVRARLRCGECGGVRTAELYESSR